jgi:predicted HD phosphohydrolase
VVAAALRGDGRKRRQDFVEGGVVGAVVVQVLVPHLGTGTHDERRAELGHTPPGLVDPVPIGTSALGTFTAPPVSEQPEEADAAHGRRVRSLRVAVDEHRERHLFVGHERGGVPHVAGADGDDLGAPSLDLVVDAPQLRGVLTAEESAEVPEEDEDHRTVGPEGAEAAGFARRIRKLQLSESGEIHGRTLWDNGAMTQTQPAKQTQPTSFRRMDESTAEQWAVIGTESFQNQGRVADRVLGMLRSLAEITDGFAVDQLTHCLQTATRAERAGADDEVVIASLCHDIGKAVSVPNHPRIAAEILKPYVRDDVYWMILVHQDFQGRHYYHHFGGDPNARDQYQGHQAYELAERFADEWDQAAFDPDYDTLPIEHFEPRLRELFGNPKSL